ncbi:hypothetical protein LCGC14_0466010 [marine sediment metagenome]|uniref:Uncharacterized protein n=1 Tax=marine sediment metagenome TaxID=412755 RepID=A0A0F9SWN2_9ZZZZ
MVNELECKNIPNLVRDKKTLKELSKKGFIERNRIMQDLARKRMLCKIKRNR